MALLSGKKISLAMLKSLRWQLLCGLLGFCCLILLVSYFLQSSSLAKDALNSGQRVLLPLTKDSQFVGQRITFKLPRKEEAVQQETPAAEEITEPLPDLAEGQKADISSSEAEKEDSYPELVVSDDLAEQVKAAEVEKIQEETKKASIEAEKTLKKESAETVESPAEAPKEEVKSPETKTTITKKVGRPLSIAPQDDLSEKVGEYLLPVIARDGTTPWRYYRKSFDDNSRARPLIAIVIHGLGLGRMTTEKALSLDPNVTLSFSPYAKNTQMWGSHARNIGHEILLDLPQESKDYPANDPGPYALLNTLDVDSNKKRLHWVMSRVPGYVGFLQTDNPADQSIDMIDAFTEVANRGVFFLEAPVDKSKELVKKQEQMGLLFHPYSRRLDEVLSKKAISKQLDLLIKDAKKNGTAIGVTRPYPLTIDMLNNWIEELESHNITLVPVSAIMNREL
jgi:polysaccharide deacetylase 2 family uncharacterized protein YibQ